MAGISRVKSKTYVDRPSSYLVAKLMEQYDKSTNDISEAIKYSPDTFKSKLKRNSFTMEDFIRIMNECLPREQCDLSPIVELYDNGGIKL